MEMITACILSFAVTVLLGWKVILPALRRLKAGQAIREEGPKWHATKAGTPTMGGLMFIIGTAISILVLGWPGTTTASSRAAVGARPLVVLLLQQARGETNVLARRYEVR